MNELVYLLSTALLIGTVHTLIGVDHYLPFVVLSKTNNWSLKKTCGIVFVCGLGHVFSSIVLGFVGLSISASLTSLIGIEDMRGILATYFIIAFGLGYTVYALHNLYKNRTHKHVIDGHELMHDHHDVQSVEDHISDKKKSNIVWGLFILFVLGPCEPLIPLLMYPASTLNVFALFSVTAVFAVSTISMMMALTLLGVKGLSFVKLKSIEKYGETLAGLAITVCGVLLITLGI